MDVYSSIIVTGGAGMLAHDLIDTLKSRGHTSTVVDRAECDITNPDEVAKLYRQTKPTLVINCAAHTAVDLCEDEPQKADAINGEGAGHLARLAKEYGTKLIQYSTDFVFDGRGDRPYRTDDAPNPISAYGASKLLGETRLQENDPPGWIIIRTAWLFGPQGNCFPKTMVKFAQSGRPLRVVNDQMGSPTYTLDLVDATLNLIDRNAKGIFHVTNSGVTSWYDFAAASLQEFGVEGDLAPVTTAEWLKTRPKQARRPAFSALDHSRYNSITGQQLRSWQEALHAYRLSCEPAAQ